MEDTNVKLVAIREDMKGIYAEVGSLTVTDQDSFVIASDVRNKVRKRKTRVDELRKQAIAPFKEEVDRYNNLFRIELDNLDELLRKVDNKLIAFTEAEEKKAREEQARLREEREKAEKEAEELRKQANQTTDVEASQKLEEEANKKELASQVVEVVEAPKTTIRSETGTMSVKKIWSYEITDVSLLMKKHPEFFVPDSKLINDFVKIVREEKEMDGLRIFQKTSLASR